MPSNDQKTTKVRAALAQLDPANDQHWTDDGLPRETAVRTFANDQSISRKDIQDAHPGFQRHPQKPEANVDPLSGEPTAAPTEAAAAADGGTVLDAHEDPTKNTGELMTDEEVRLLLEQRVKDRGQGVVDAQQAIREANQGLIDAQAALQHAREDLTREFPPLTAAQNIKEYIRSEQMQRERMAQPQGVGNIAPGSQIDAAMQRSNSRGWRRPSRVGPTQLGAAKAA